MSLKNSSACFMPVHQKRKERSYDQTRTVKQSLRVHFSLEDRQRFSYTRSCLPPSIASLCLLIACIPAIIVQFSGWGLHCLDPRRQRLHIVQRYAIKNNTHNAHCVNDPEEVFCLSN